MILGDFSCPRINQKQKKTGKCTKRKTDPLLLFGSSLGESGQDKPDPLNPTPFVTRLPRIFISFVSILGFLGEESMNPLTSVKQIQSINSKESDLEISDEASWHNNYKDSPYVFVGGISHDLTGGDLLAVFAQYEFLLLLPLLTLLNLIILT